MSKRWTQCSKLTSSGYALGNDRQHCLQCLPAPGLVAALYLYGPDAGTVCPWPLANPREFPH